MNEEFFKAEIAPYLLGISQNALVGALTAWAQKRDDQREQSGRNLQFDREQWKPLQLRIEQKLMSTLSSLPEDNAAAKSFIEQIRDPIFVDLLAKQVLSLRPDEDNLINEWIFVRPEIESYRLIVKPFLGHFLAAVISEIAADQSFTNILQMAAIGRLDQKTESIASILSPLLAINPCVLPTSEQIMLACDKASQALRFWPTTIEGERIESSAFASLVEPITDDQQNVQVLLGEPGSGKSALLGELAKYFSSRQSVVLAIKADLLPTSVNSVASLGRELNLGEAPDRALESIAGASEVVVLIDQLDALADLVDLKSGRLSAVLQFVRGLAGIRNIRVILSSREVEFRHDVRFTSMSADAVTLPLPDWEKVQLLIEKQGIKARDWPDTFKEILRRPQQLAIFIKLTNSKEGNSKEEMEIFTSYQQMLERLWAVYVTNIDGLPGRAELLRDLARRMASDEVLWLSRARFDSRSLLIDQLIASGILRVAPDERCIGFQHQTVFDFAFARSFADDGLTLADFVLSRQQSLFVRPRLWSALVFLRGTELQKYRQEFTALWQTQGLRYHIKLQLIEFLGHLENPDHHEEVLLSTVFNEQSLRPTALIAIVGRRIWFERLARTILPELMRNGGEMCNSLANVLCAAGKFNSQTVLLLLREHWISNPAMDWFTSSTLASIQSWDVEASKLAVALAGRAPMSVSRLSDLITSAMEVDCSLALPILVAFLDRLATEVELLPSEVESSEPEESIARMFDSSPRQKAIDAVFRDNDDWPDFQALAESVPSEFIDQIWPSFVRLLSSLDDNNDESGFTFPREAGLNSNFGREDAPLLVSFQTAVANLARTNIIHFKNFLERAGGTNSMTIQRMLARSLAGIGASEPVLGLDFLVGDVRRFRLGDYMNQYSDTSSLISSISPHLLSDQLRTLENAIAELRSPMRPDTDVDLGKIESWSRRIRARLWAQIPEENRSAEISAAVIKEGFFPKEDSHSYVPVEPSVSPTISAQEMEVLSDSEILEDLNKTTFSEESENRISARDDIAVAKEFGDFAKNYPERAWVIISQLDPNQHARIPAKAVDAIAQSDASDERIFDFMRRVREVNFSDIDFKCWVAGTFESWVEKRSPLPDDLFSMFETWLRELATSDSQNDVTEVEEPGTILWKTSHSWPVPYGSYRMLTVLEAASQAARQADRFVTILHEHLERPERTSTWRALCNNFRLLRQADKQHSSRFLVELFRRYPQVRDSILGSRAFAEAMEWLPTPAVREMLDDIEQSANPNSHRVFGELLMYRHALWEDEATALKIERLLAAEDTPPTVLVGIATSAAHTFFNDKASLRSATVLQNLIRKRDLLVTPEVLGMFAVTPKLIPTPQLLAVLNTFLENPSTLRPDALGPLLERLPDLIPDYSLLVADIADNILASCSSELLDFQTSLSASANEFINLAITLHRDDGAGRDRGLLLFERLLSLNVSGIRQSLFEVDSRPVAYIRHRKRRRRTSNSRILKR